MIALSAVLEASLACLPPGGPARSSGQDLGLRSQTIGRFGLAISTTYRNHQDLKPALLQLIQAALYERGEGLVVPARGFINPPPTLPSPANRALHPFWTVPYNACFIWHNALLVSGDGFDMSPPIIQPKIQPCQEKKSGKNLNIFTSIQNNSID